MKTIKYCKCGQVIKNFYAKRCRTCYLKAPDKDYSHNLTEIELKKRAEEMSRRRKNGSISTWNKGKDMWKERPELVLQFQKILKGKRCNPKGEFKKGHNNSLLQRKNFINRHHLDLNKYNHSPNNLIYLSNSNHNSLHKRAYDYLVKTNQIKDYLRWFLITYRTKLYTKKTYIDVNKKITQELRRK